MKALQKGGSSVAPLSEHYSGAPQWELWFAVPVLVLGGLVLLALLAAVIFFWSDLFGGGGSAGSDEMESDEMTAATEATGAPSVSSTTEGPNGGQGNESVASSEGAAAVGAGTNAPDASPTTSPSTSPAAASPPAPSPSPASSAVPPAASFDRLLDISWRPVAGGLEVIFTTNGVIPEKRWRHFRLGGETPREVVRILGVTRPFGESPIQVGGPGVQQIRIGYHRKNGGNELHVVLDLSSPQAEIGEVRAEGEKLVVRVKSP